MVNFFEIVKAVFLLTFPLKPDLRILWDIPTAKSAWQKQITYHPKSEDAFGVSVLQWNPSVMHDNQPATMTGIMLKA